MPVKTKGGIPASSAANDRHTVIGIVSYGYSVINLLYHIKHQIAIGLNHFLFADYAFFGNDQQERLSEIQNSSRST